MNFYIFLLLNMRIIIFFLYMLINVEVSFGMHEGDLAVYNLVYITIPSIIILNHKFQHTRYFRMSIL